MPGVKRLTSDKALLEPIDHLTYLWYVELDGDQHKDTQPYCSSKAQLQEQNEETILPQKVLTGLLVGCPRRQPPAIALPIVNPARGTVHARNGNPPRATVQDP